MFDFKVTIMNITDMIVMITLQLTGAISDMVVQCTKRNASLTNGARLDLTTWNH